MNRVADLQQLLRFYDQNMRSGGTPNAYQQSTGFVGGGGETRPGLLWAQDQLDRSGAEGAPDFFGDEEPRNAITAFVRPSGAGAGPMPPRADMGALDVPPRSIRRDTPMRGRTNTILANLMRMR